MSQISSETEYKVMLDFIEQVSEDFNEDSNQDEILQVVPSRMDEPSYYGPDSEAPVMLSFSN